MTRPAHRRPRAHRHAQVDADVLEPRPPHARVSTAASSAPDGAVPVTGDPWGARLIFYVVGDTKACTRFLVLVVVLLAATAVLALVSPAAATALGSMATAAAGLAGGRRALSWWRSRSSTEPQQPPSSAPPAPGAT